MSKSIFLIKRYSLLIFLLILWYVWGIIYQPLLAPIPTKSLSKLVELLISGDIPLALFISLKRILIGLIISISLALIIGILMGYFKKIEKNLDPIIQTVRHIAPIAFVPLAILWFGSGTPSSVFIIAFASFFPMVLNVINGVKEIDQILIKAARTMGIKGIRLFFRIILPAAFPSILNGIRVSTGIAWMSVIAAELFISSRPTSVGSSGIGQMMFNYYSNSIDTNSLIACMVGLGVVSLILDSIFKFTQNKWANWEIE